MDRHFAAVGAIAGILALGFDPFIQNLVQFSTKYGVDVKQSHQDPAQSDISFSTEWNFAGQELLTYQKSSIGSALYSEGKNAFMIPQYTCTSGNCTWYGYTTLAVKWKCADLTPKLNQSCLNANADPVYGAPCDWSLPNGMSLGIDGRTVMAVNASRPSIAFEGFANPWIVVQLIGQSSYEFMNSSVQAYAAECILYPAVKALNSSVGQFPAMERYKWDPEGTRSFGTDDNYMEYELDTYEKYVYVPPPNTFYGGKVKGTKYWISNQAVVLVQNQLKLLFQGFVRANGIDNYTNIAELNNNGQSDVLQIFHDLQSRPYCYDDDFGTYPGITGMQCTVQNMAYALTTLIRDSIGTSSKFRGDLIDAFTQVNVTWSWIIIPVIIWRILTIALRRVDWSSGRRN